MLRRVLPLALLVGCSHPRPAPAPTPPSPQVTIHLDPLRFKPDATLTIELVIGSGYSCSKRYPMPMTEPAPTPSPAPCMAPPPPFHEQYAERVAGRSAIVIASGQLMLGRDFTVIVTGPAAEGCDLLRGTARGIATGGAVEVPALELVAIPQPCPA
ncbi:MAG: hypothetical protein IPH44_29645 [Myxococcales bacterium]|nr:hypothetical protein [Myxococcales bacterium]MBK7192153.1 hypothetical protein [Myxococcales bacterium]MBP6845240.1 hypothetical protein [Kofleriaceae bacterium]